MDSPQTPMAEENDGLNPELDSEEDGTKVLKPPGTVGRPQSGGYNLQDKLGWNDTTYQSILVSFCYNVLRSIMKKTYRVWSTNWQRRG